MPSVRSLVKTMNNAERYLYVDLYTCIKKHYEEVTQIINIEISLPGFVSLMVLFSPQPLDSSKSIEYSARGKTRLC